MQWNVIEQKRFWFGVSRNDQIIQAYMSINESMCDWIVFVIYIK